MILSLPKPSFPLVRICLCTNSIWPNPISITSLDVVTTHNIHPGTFFVGFCGLYRQVFEKVKKGIFRPSFAGKVCSVVMKHMIIHVAFLHLHLCAVL